MISQVLEYLGVRAFVAGDYERAARHFERVQKRNPERTGINHNLGLVRLAQRRFEEAEELFLKDLERFGESYRRLRVAGDLYYVWGKREEAREFYQKAREECRRDEELELLDQRMQNCSDELSFERVLESHRLFNEGNNAMKANDYETARQHYEKAIECDGTNYQAMNNLGAVWMNFEKQPDRAVEYFQRAAELSNLGSVGANLQKARKRAGVT